MNILPSSDRRTLQFANGTAIGMSHRWQQGQYCSILTEAGIVGCGIYDCKTAAEFGQAVAIARGTPANPLCQPEDLYEAKIVEATPKAKALGIEIGMKGKEAVELMLKAGQCGTSQSDEPASRSEAAHTKSQSTVPDNCRAQGLDHVTLVVADLDRSEWFYCGILGMKCVARPNFSFPGRWFQAGNSQVHLILQHEGSAPAGFPAPPDYASPGRTFHYAFEVADANAALARLKEHRVELKGQPRHRPDGCLQVFCVDPDGHIVEVFSRP